LQVTHSYGPLIGNDDGADWSSAMSMHDVVMTAAAITVKSIRMWAMVPSSTAVVNGVVRG